MKSLGPHLATTFVHPQTREWIPESFESFLQELHHLVKSCHEAKTLALFRGHSKRQWSLDSTFVRSFKTTLFGVRPDEKLSRRIVESAECHLALLNLYLLKFGVLTHPSDELEAAAREHGLDPWFEWMKRLQQYPGDDGFFLKGTNLLDWTQSADVALYFANENRAGDGAIYICDATATGKTLQVVPVAQILNKMREIGNSGAPLGAPLLFCPPRQIFNPRPKNQQVVYFAQMDLRYDLETIWRLREAELENETIVFKLILPAGSEATTREYLIDKGLNHAFIFPDEQIAA
jgi:hypothetical protein